MKITIRKKKDYNQLVKAQESLIFFSMILLLIEKELGNEDTIFRWGKGLPKKLKTTEP